MFILRHSMPVHIVHCAGCHPAYFAAVSGLGHRRISPRLALPLYYPPLRRSFDLASDTSSIVPNVILVYPPRLLIGDAIPVLCLFLPLQGNLIARSHSAVYFSPLFRRALFCSFRPNAIWTFFIEKSIFICTCQKFFVPLQSQRF